MIFGSFKTPSRCSWPSSDTQRWGKEWSTMRLRVTLWSYFGAESECGGGRCLRYFDYKILLFYAEHDFGSFSNPSRSWEATFSLPVFITPYTTNLHSSLKYLYLRFYWYLIILLEVMPSQAQFTRKRFFISVVPSRRHLEWINIMGSGTLRIHGATSFAKTIK